MVSEMQTVVPTYMSFFNDRFVLFQKSSSHGSMLNLDPNVLPLLAHVHVLFVRLRTNPTVPPHFGSEKLDSV